MGSCRWCDPERQRAQPLNVLNVLGLRVELEPAAADLLARICTGPLLDDASLRAVGVFVDALQGPSQRPRKRRQRRAPDPNAPELDGMN